MSELRTKLSKIARKQIKKYTSRSPRQYCDPRKLKCPTSIEGYAMKFYGTHNSDKCVKKINKKLAKHNLTEFKAVVIQRWCPASCDAIQIVKVTN